MRPHPPLQGYMHRGHHLLEEKLMSPRPLSAFQLALSTLLFLTLACGIQSQATPTLDPTVVALAVQQTVQAGGSAVTSGPPPATIPASTEFAPTEPAVSPSDTPVPPTPTIVHVATPVNPSGTNSFMTDRSSAALALERHAIGDNLDIGLLERPFTANVMDYQGYLDVNRGELSKPSPWVYVTLFLEQTPPAGAPATYGVEVDIDIDGRGDFLIVGAAPSGTDWTTDWRPRAARHEQRRGWTASHIRRCPAGRERLRRNDLRPGPGR